MTIRNEFEDKSNFSSNELTGREDAALIAQVTEAEVQDTGASADQQVAQLQNAEPTTTPHVTLIEIEDGSIARLPEGASVDQPRMNGTNLEFVQADGSVIVIPNGAIQGLTLFIGNIEIPPQTVAALFEANAIQPAAGPDGGAAGAPGSSGGNFEHRVPGIGEGLAFSDLLGATELAFGAPSFARFNTGNFVPVFGSAFLTLNGVSDEGLSEGNIDSAGSNDGTDGASSSGTLDVSDRDGDFLNFTMGTPGAALTSGGVAIVWDISGENILIGRAGDTEIIRLTVTEGRTADGGGNYVVELKGPIDHPNDGRPGSEDDLSIGIPIVVFDGRGGSATSTLVLTIEDDSPVLTKAAPASEGEEGQLAQPLRSVTVDEDGLSQGNGNDDSPGDHAVHATSATGDLGISWGADRGDTHDATLELGGFSQDAVDGKLAGRAVYFASDIVAVTGAAGEQVEGGGVKGLQIQPTNQLYSSGALVTYELSPDGSKLIGLVKGSGDDESAIQDRVVFEVTLSDDGSGKFNFRLLGQLDHAPGNAENDITLTFDFIARDFDGDTVDGSFVVTVDDDMPTINAITPISIANGEFNSEGDFQNDQSWGASDSDGIAGWTITGSPLERVNDGYLDMHTSNGNPMIDMAASPGNLTLSQDVSNLLNGHTYAIQFEAGAPFPDSATLEVYWGDVLVGTIHPSTTMTSYNYVVTATGNAALDKLTFKEVGNFSSDPVDGPGTHGDHGTYLTNVAIVAASVVDEDGLAGNAGGIGDADGVFTEASGNLGINWGADNGDVLDVGGVQDTAGRSVTFSDLAVSVSGVGAEGLTSLGEEVQFRLEEHGTRLVGYVAASGEGEVAHAERVVFEVTLSDDGTGSYHFTLLDQLDHAPGGDENDITLTFNFTAEDFDGDKASGSFVVAVDDDGPSVTLVALGDDAATLTTHDALTPGVSFEFVTASFANLFGANIAYGADGAGVAPTWAYALQLAVSNGAASGLFSDGTAIKLFISNGEVYGSTAADADAAANNYVFKISADTSGNITLTQAAEVDHAVPGSSSNYATQLVELADGLVKLVGTVTVTDGDGDTASNSTTIDLGGNVRFADDGPSVTVATLADAGTTLVTHDALTPGAGSETVSASFAGLFAATPAYGADGPGASSTWTYALQLAVSNGATSGLSSDGVAIRLYTVGNEIYGSTTSSDGQAVGQAVFKLSVAADGTVSLTQFGEIDHTAPGSSSNYATQLAELANGLVKLVGTVTVIDGDGDTASGSATIDLGGNIRFADDGPSVVSANSELRNVYENDIDTSWSQGTSPNDGNADGGTPNSGSYTNSPNDNSSGPAVISGSLAFLVNFGSDGAAGSNAFSFTADWQTYLTSLHLFSKETALPENGQELVYSKVGNVITATEPDSASHGNSSNTVFTLTLNADGTYVFRLYDELIHEPGDGANTQLRSGPSGTVEGIDFGKIIQATDGDGDSVTLDGKFVVKVVDDVPEAHITLRNGTVQVDESGNNDSWGDDNTSSSSVRNQFKALEEANPNQEGDDPHIGGDNNGSTSGNGAIAYARSDSAIVDVDTVIGADAPTLSNSLSLGLFGANGQTVSSLGSGLFTTGGNAITLELWGGLIVGRVQAGGTDTSGVVAFAIAIDNDGRVSVAQYLSLKHPDGSDSDEGIALDLAHVVGGTVRAVVSVTDSDGDTATDSVSIGSKITFEDDAPTAGSNDHVVLEDDDLPNGIDGGLGDDPAPQNASGTLAHDYGTDGGTTLLTGVSLPANAGFTSVVTNGGLTVTISQNGSAVLLVQLTDTTSGHYTVNQLQAIDHPAGNNENNVDFTINYQVKDGDGDTKNGSVSLTVDDDTPTVNAIASSDANITLLTHDAATSGSGSETVTANFAGLFSAQVAYGADGAGVSPAWSYALQLAVNNGSSSGLSSDGDTIRLFMINGVVYGSTTNNSNNAISEAVFKVVIDAAGTVTLTQYSEVDHATNNDTSAPYDDQLVTLANDLIKVVGTITVTDGDGDKVNNSATIDLGGNIRFADDGPSVAAKVNADANVLLTTQDDDTIGSDTDTSTANFGSVFSVQSSSYGADGTGSTNWSFGLSITAPLTNGHADSGLGSNGAPIYLYNVNGAIVGSTSANANSVSSGNTIFKLTVDGSGSVTLTQYSEIDHANNNDTSSPYSDQVATLSDGIIKLTGTVTITDGDGDKASDSKSIDLGGNIRFADDGPSISAKVVGDDNTVLKTDDRDTIGAASDTNSANFGSLFSVQSSSFGADGSGSTAWNYALGLNNGQGSSSGQFSNGVAVKLYLVNGEVIGSTAASAVAVDISNTVFKLMVTNAGSVTLTQYAEIDHTNNNDTSSPYDDQYAALANNLIKLTGTVTITDGDGDKASDSKSIDLGGNVRFADDGPSVTVSTATESTVLLSTQDGDTIGSASDTAVTTANFGDAFQATVNYGADGPGTTAWSYELDLGVSSGTASGLKSDGVTIVLREVNGMIYGTTSTSQTSSDIISNAVFSISVDGTGKVTLTQFREIDHGTPGNSSNYDSQLASLAANTVKLIGTVTVTDGDGDKAIKSSTIEIGDNIRFADHGPSITAAVGSDANVQLNTFDAQTIGAASSTASVGFGGLFSINSSSYGADGAGNTSGWSYALSVSAAPVNGVVDSGLDSNGASIYLYQVNGTVVGSTAATALGIIAANIVFSLAVNGSGSVTLTQLAEIDHAAGSDVASLADNLVKLTGSITITDGDGDTATSSAVIDLGGNVRFGDDGPSVSVAVGTDAALALTTQDADTIGANTDTTALSFGSVFTATPNYGADGAGSVAWNYGLSLVSNGVDSTLNANGADIRLYVIDGVVVGSTSTTSAGVTNANTIFNISVSGAGTVTLTQFSQIDHALGSDLATLANGLVSLSATATVTDGDGDTATSTKSVDLGGNIAFADDVPSASDYAGSTFLEGSGSHDIGIAYSLLGILPGADVSPIVAFSTGDKGGSLSVDLNGHLIYVSPANVTSGSTVTETFSYTVTDKDGDVVTRQITFGVSDTGITMGAAPTNLVADEDDITSANGNANGPGDAASVTTGHLFYTLGADALQSVALSVANTGLTTLNGTTVSTIWNAASNTLTGYGATESDVVFTIKLSNVNATGADYTIELLQPVTHPGHDNPSTGGTPETTYEDDLGFTVVATVTDADGSTGTANFAVTIDDDSVFLSDYALHPTFAEGSGAHDLGVAKNLLDISAGADGQQSLIFTVGDKGGTLSIDLNGHLIYTAPTQVTSGSTLLESIAYTLTDKDGDTVTRHATINVSDTGVTMGSAPANNLVVDEDDIGTSGNAGGPGDATPLASGHISYTLGTDALQSVALSIVSTGLTKLNGTAVNTTWDAATKTLTGYGASPADVVFTIKLSSVNATGADYTIALLQPVAHPGHDDPSTAGTTETSFEDNLGFTVVATVTDADGSTGTTSFAVSIDDDTPTATNDVWSPQITGATVLTGLLTNDAFGADGVDTDNSPTTGQVVVSTQAAHGTAFYNSTGTFTYTPNAGYNGADSFAYTTKDADGDTSTATVTLNDIHTNSVPSAGTAAATVDDEGLANGNPGGVNDMTVGSPESVANGTLPHDFNTDGKAVTDPISFSTMNATSGTVGTESVTYAWNSATNTLTASSARGDIFTVNVDGNSDSGAGNYTVTLLKPVLHALGDNENSANVALSYTVKDSNADTVNGTLTVTFNDDTPIAEANTATVTAGTINEVDVVLIVDVSGSMDDAVANVPNFSDDRIGLARYSMLQMLTNNEQIDNVMIVKFASNASGGSWMSRADAITYVNTNTNWTLGNDTNYDVALQRVIDNYGNARPGGASPETLIYFMSDGEPTTGNGITNTGDNGNVSIAEWETFVNTPANHISEVYAVGIGPDVSSAALSPISYPNTDGPDAGTVEDHVILIPNQNDVAAFVDTLQGAVGNASSITGNILVDDPSTTTGADSFGADGGYIQSVTVNGVTYTFNGTNSVAEASSTPSGYVDHGTWIEVPTALGGKLTFYFATTGAHVAGDWGYLAPTNTGGGESFAYTLIDRDGDTVSSSLGISVIESNDAPAGTSSSVTILEDSSLVLGAANFGFTDPNDSPANALMNVIITEITGAGKLMNNGVEVSAGAIISASDVTDGGLQFIPNTNANGTATISFKVQDDGGTANGGVDTDPSANTLTINITAVNDAPEEAGTSAVTFNENGSALVINSGLALSDVDSTNLTGASAKITGNFTTGDTLSFTAQGSIGGSYNAATGVLTLTGTGTLAQYQSVLRSISFRTTSENPNTATRTVSFQVDDGQAANHASNVINSTITVVATNDAPVLVASGSTNYAENGSASVVSSALTVADVDSPTLDSATIKISSNFSAGDMLNFTNQNGISGSYNTATGVLTLSGAASAADYQTALRSVTYSTTSENPSTSIRTVTFQVDDGASANDLSNIVTRTISVSTVNDAPVVTASGSIAYTENGAAKVINSALTVTDVDSSNLTGATVKIGTGFVTGDVLGFANQNGITGNYNSATGILTLSGTATVAFYQTALRSVTYLSTSEDPTGADRMISYQVTDTGAPNATSLAATTTIVVTPVDDVMGNLTDTNSAANSISEMAAIGSSVGITASSVDLDDTVTYRLTNDANGRFTINASTGVVTVASALDYEIATSHTIAIEASNGNGSIKTLDATINVANVTGSNGDDNDTYSRAPGSTSDIDDSNGGSDRIVFTANGATLTSLNFLDAGNNDLDITTNNGTVTVNNHFSNQTVEYLHFQGGGIYAGYQLGDDTYVLSTDSDSNRQALAGQNTILAGDNSGETLTGNSGDDLLFGNGGNDTLNGGGGNDLLVGGTGADTLTGGTGADTFAMTDSASKDTITDYVFGQGDSVDLSQLLDANFGPSSNVSDFVQLTQNGTTVSISVDVNGTSGGSSFTTIADLSGIATGGVDSVKIIFEGVEHTLQI